MNCYRFPLLGPLTVPLLDDATGEGFATDRAFAAFEGKVTISFFVENDYRTDDMRKVGVLHITDEISDALDGEVDWDLSFLVGDEPETEMLRLQQANDDGERIEFSITKDMLSAIEVAFDAWQETDQRVVFQKAMLAAKKRAKAVSK